MNKGDIDKLFDNELFRKVDNLSSQVPEGDKLVVLVGTHYWNMVPSIWRFDWIQSEGRRGLCPVEKTEIDLQRAIIRYDPNHKYTFDVIEQITVDK